LGAASRPCKGRISGAPICYLLKEYPNERQDLYSPYPPGFQFARSMPSPSFYPRRTCQSPRVGRQMNPPVNVSTLLQEAEKWGVECEYTSRLKISSCRTKIETAQLKAQGQELDKETARLIIELQELIEKKNNF
jgi:hypothetical protein